MKPEFLETLLLDRALGSLAPEVADLLDAHLARDPAAAARAAALAATVALTRAAVALPHERAVRADAAGWARVQRTTRWRTAGLEALKLAAALALGLWLAFAWRARPSAAPLPLAEARPAAVASTVPAFWSTARVVAAARSAAPARADDFNRFQPRWFAPAKPPQPVEDRQ